MKSVERILEIKNLDSEAALKSPRKRTVLSEDATGELEFKDVSLCYADNQRYALKQVDFLIRKGERVRNFYLNLQIVVAENLCKTTNL